jgi:hypothetical protein
MAWIPKPCGELRIVGGAEERTTREVCCEWRERVGEREVVRSRLPGMWSSLRASFEG